ncbi:DUF72 domain-containing protein [Variovorax sp. J22P271]|uniref:DUF72 domain-containing protein n=1 Tax=Variovorax davisae TaxID=3053515 RepID=UPI0025749D08|nr:DUF72 domain-containing protein [Variovorax sp. J22P271]MDM0035914.1 DUF72 domain-containing protein [Variovorax sp. J22P271]
MAPQGSPALPALQLGCAGWSLARAHRDRFGAADSQLASYATRLPAVEINSSFHRPHRRETYERWAASTPPQFRFSAKCPKTITHELRLQQAMPALDGFLAQAAGLGPKLGCLLIQLPPSLGFDAASARRFVMGLRARHDGAVALEARHPTWFDAAADRLLARARIARVLADPVLFPAAAVPGGWPQLVYLRLHGSPRRYWSRYDDALLRQLAERLAVAQRSGARCWCIFDNTAAGEAVPNALTLQGMMATLASGPCPVAQPAHSSRTP